jgi:hypothetical protein
MAIDSIHLNEGFRRDIAVDIVDGKNIQLVKVVGGPEGTITDTGMGAVALHTLIPNEGAPDQALTVDNTVGGVQFAAFDDGTTHVEWDNQEAQCRVTFDGSAPTATNGHLIEIGATDVWSVAKAAAAKFVRTTDDNAIIHASQLRGA